MLNTDKKTVFTLCNNQESLPLSVHKLHFLDRSFDLQLFSGEKTEAATPKRRQEALSKGNVPKSQDLNSVVIILAAFVGLKIFGAEMIKHSSDYMRYCLEHLIHTEFAFGEIMELLYQLVIATIWSTAPVLIVVLVSSLGVNLYQVGIMLNFDPFIPDISKINPISNLKNIFSSKMIVELIKSFFKILVVAYIPYNTIVSYMPSLIGYMELDVVKSNILMLEIVFSMAIKIIMLLLVIAFIDWYYQKWKFEENLKMSKQEVKEEHKQSEGDPKIKQKIRERQRQASTRKMMDAVPSSTVVVTNPTHIACALKYDPEEMSGAPVVVAKGANLIAEAIKKIAKENNVPIFENKPLARALFKMVEIGDEIHPDLYAAVVEILAQIYRSRSASSN